MNSWWSNYDWLAISSAKDHVSSFANKKTGKKLQLSNIISAVVRCQWWSNSASSGAVYWFLAGQWWPPLLHHIRFLINNFGDPSLQSLLDETVNCTTSLAMTILPICPVFHKYIRLWEFHFYSQSSRPKGRNSYSSSNSREPELRYHAKW